MELKKLFKSTSQLGVARIVQVVLGIFKAKLEALLIGTTGVGIVTQVNFTSRQLSQFTLLGMNDGLTKQIAESKQKENFREIFCSAQKSYFLLSGLVTIISLTFILFFSKKLTIYFFGDEEYLKYFLIAVSIFPILLLNSYSYAILKAFKSIKYIARAEIVSIIVSFIVFIPLIFLFKIYGAVFSIVIMFLAKLIFNHYNAKKYILNNFNITYKDIFKSKVDTIQVKELLLFGSFGLSLGLYQIIIEVAGRGILINQLGIDQLGLYSPGMNWGGKFQAIVLPALYTYLYPRFSELKNDNKSLTAIINDAWRMVGIFAIFLLFGGISLRYLVVPLFYSKEFTDAAIYIPGHFFGIFLFMLVEALGQVFTPTGRIKIYGFMQFFRITFRLLVLYYLIPLFGLGGYMLRFIIPPLIFVVVYYLYLHKTIGLKISKDNLLLFTFIIIGSVALYFLSEYNSWFAVFAAIIITSSVYFILKKTEKKQIVKKIHTIKSKIFFKRK
ncbi:MAG: polysaccharide biosynthesis C-terminal domain-containing protein [Bacteroidales bacterium]|nr:polysaccharide biosynthesis C-terminal domain-containing protein [Bacteroidales bacterium]